MCNVIAYYAICESMAEIRGQPGWLIDKGSYWTEKETSCVTSVVWHISWEYVTTFHDLATPFCDLVDRVHEYVFEGSRKFWTGFCLDLREVTKDIWKKWWACMHWVTSSNRCVSIMYGIQVNHSPQVVKTCKWR